MRHIRAEETNREDVELPRIALVTPSYNQAQFIDATITSVLDQTYPRLEYVVQDGGSSDGTVEILRRHAGRLTHWDSQRDAGQANAINLALARTSGDIMGYLNSDDLLMPGALRAVGRYFARHPEVDVIYGDRILIDTNGDEIGDWRLPPHAGWVLKWADYIPQETLFWRRSAWEKAGGQLDETFQFAMDWDLILRLHRQGARFHHMRRFLGAFRVHAQQKTTSVSSLGVQEMARLRQRELGFSPTPNQVRLTTLPYLLEHMLIDAAQRSWERIARRAAGGRSPK